jgi:hypothetical protein
VESISFQEKLHCLGKAMKTIGLLIIGTFWCAIVMGQTATTNTITVKKSNDCFENNLYAPTIFTPNGDAVNDDFLPLCLQKTDFQFKFRIVNKEKELVYETTNPYKSWYGNDMNSKTAEEGIYLWTADVIDRQGEKHQFKGAIILAR